MRYFCFHFLAIAIILFASACKGSRHEYNYLVEEAGDNRIEIKKLIDFHDSLSAGPKKQMTEYILDKIPFQYQLQVNLTYKSGKRIILTDPIISDSLEVLRNQEGTHFRIDTLWDRHILKAAFIIALINDCDSLRRLDPFSKIPLPEFCEYILPYRINNEQIFPYKSIFGSRYLSYLPDVLLKNTDTIRNLRSYLDPYFSSLFFPSLKYIDFFSTPNYYSVLQQGKSYADYEDVMTLNIHALRAIGIPCTYEYIPSVKRSPNEVIRINMLDNKGETHYNADGVKWPYKFMIAKAYRNTFDVRKAVNPYAELKKDNVPEEDIPLSLNIPKVIDITEQRTITKNLTLSVPDSIKQKGYVYIAALRHGDWKIQSWGKVNPETKMATFNNMGIGMLYHLACFHKGRTELFGTPFIADSLGHVRKLAATNGLTPIKLGRAGESTPINSQTSYAIYYWDPRRPGWSKISAVKEEHDSLNIANAFPDALYKVVSGANDGLKENIFTLDNAEQTWW